jgi:hypothetical protein
VQISQNIPQLLRRQSPRPAPAKSFTVIHLSFSTGAKISLSFGTGSFAPYRLLADSLRGAHP